MSLAQTIRGALLTDFLGALVVATREVFTRKATVNYPFEKKSSFAALSRGTRFAALSQR